MNLACKLLCLIGLFAAAQANVIGIDFGSDSMKVGLVQPGTPIDIVTNFQSKRKTPMSVSFYRGERQFGADSIALLTRKPELTFSKIFRLVGRHANHPHVQELMAQYFPRNVETDETTGRMLLREGEIAYTSEELVAMMMQHAKDMTLNFGGRLIKDCVVTVPSYFTQQERRALYVAAEIADLKILSLIEENTAAALQYGMDRVFDQPSTVLYYNMGSGSVQVTVVTYSSFLTKEGGKNKTVGQFEVMGKGWDSSLGGFNIDIALAELLADRFNALWQKKASGKGKDVREFIRPMTRLRGEATKIKEVLSANNEYPVRIEQLHGDTDLVTKVTRSDLETAAASLFARLTAPIDQALAQANLTVADLNAVELLGGAVRIPRVKKLLDEYFNSSAVEVGQHLNGDEAMAVGASFRAANLSTAFRVRKVGMVDFAPFGVTVHLETLPVEASTIKPAGGGIFGSLFGSSEKTAEPAVEAASGEETWSKQTLLYSPKSKLSPKLKTVSFTYDKDVLCRLEYTEPALLPPGTGSILAEFNITGVAAFVEKHKNQNASAPKVQLSFSLDGDGVYNLVKAEVTAELSTAVEVIEEDIMPVNETAANETHVANATETTPKKDSKPIIHKKESHLRAPLTVVENLSRILPSGWSPVAIAEASARLRALDAADAARKAKEAALNELEAYCYTVKNKLSDNEESYKKVSTDEQRQEVVSMANAAEEWIYDDGRDATVGQYKAKQSELKKKAEAIFHRFEELTARPDAVATARKYLKGLKSTVAEWSLTKPQVTEKEVEGLLDQITKAEDWMDTKVAAQALKSDLEDAVFESSDISVQLKPVKASFDKLSRKPKPPPQKPVKVNDTSSGNSTDTSSSSANETASANSTESQSGESSDSNAGNDGATEGAENADGGDEL